MDNSVLFMCVLALILVHTKAQDDPMVIGFRDPSDRYVALGAEVTLVFELNRSPMFALQNSVQLLRHRRDAAGKMVEDRLTESGKLVDAEPEFYDAEMDMDVTDKFIITFKIKQVRNIDDATFICKAQQENGPQANSSLQIFVLRPNTKVSLKFADKGAIDESMSVPFAVDADTYPVECTAEGSNPATSSVNIFWNGNTIDTTKHQPVEMTSDDGLRRFSVTVKGQVAVGVANSGQDLECMASSMAGEQLSTKVPIKVNVYNPPVECEEATAFAGQRYPEINCVVDTTGMDIDSYGYEFGTTGTIVHAGEQSPGFDEVITKDLGDSKVQVQLKLFKTKQHHFSKYYLIINHKNGHTTKEAVVLTEVEDTGNQGGSGNEGPSDSSSRLGASVATFVLCALLALFGSL